MSEQKFTIEEILREAKKLRQAKEAGSSSPTSQKDNVPQQTSVTVSLKKSDGEVRNTIVKIINNGTEQPISAKDVTVERETVSLSSLSKKTMDESTEKPDNSILKEIRERKAEYTSVSNATKPTDMKRKKFSFATPDANADTKTMSIDIKELRKLTPKRPSNPKAVHMEQFEKTISIDKIKIDEKSTKGIKDQATLNMYSSDQATTESFPVIAPKEDFSFTVPKNAREVARQNNENKKHGHNRFIKGSVIKKNEKTAELLFSKEPPKTIERPAVMRGQTKFEKTGDLESIPEIMSVEDYQSSDLAKQKATKRNSEQTEDTYAVQIKLDGFEDQLENIPKIHEEDAEKELYHRRQKKVGEFRLSDKHREGEEYDGYFEYGEETEVSTAQIDDYNSPMDKDSLMNHLSAKAKKLSVKSIATGILTLMMAFFSLLQSMNALPSAISDTDTFTIFMCVVGGMAVLFNLSTVGNGFLSIFNRKADSDLPLAVATVFVVVHSVLCFVSEEYIGSGFNVFMLALSFGFLCNNLGKQALVRRISTNFDFLTSEGEKYTISNIDDQKDITVMCQGLLMGEPVVKRSVLTKFPTDFLKIAYSDEPSDKLCRRITPFTILIALVIGGVSYFVGKDWMSALTAATCAICLGVPIASLLISNIKLLDISKQIKSRGAMINGYAGAEKMADANAIIFDAASLFPADSCDFHGVKTFGGTRIDDAILQTAAVVISTQSPLKDVFNKVIVGKQSILPDVDTIVYEERMGTSAWIYGKKVLVGNRQLMLQHGIHMPSEEFESKYKHNDRYLLYLAVAGKLVAMFVVSYSPNSAVKKELNRLEKSGMTVLVRTTDSNIDEEMLTEQYDLVDGFVRVLNTASGRVFEKYSFDKVDEAPAYVVNNGTADAFTSTMYASDILNNSKNILSILQIFGIAISLALVAIFAIYGGLSQITPLTIVIFQAIWSAFVLFISKLRK